MANIQPYIDDILAAVYGEQVRSSIADAILAINDAAITSVVLGTDNKLVITFQDGHTYTSASLKGAKGDKGDTGETGETGETGATGNGIASIALISTVGLVKTYRITYTNGNHFDFEVSDGDTNGAVKFTEQSLTESQKAQARENINASAPDGYYGDSGGVYQYSTNFIGKNAPSNVNNLVYRPTASQFSGQSWSADSIGGQTATIEKIKGNTIVVNQLIPHTHIEPTQTINGVTVTNNFDGTFTANGTATGGRAQIPLVNWSYTNRAVGHKCLLFGTAHGSSPSTYGLRFYGYSSTDYGDGVIHAAFVESVPVAYCSLSVEEGVTVTNLVFKPNIVDLTEWFGQGNEPTTPEDAFARGVPRTYIPYNEGELISLNATGLKTTGFNQLYPDGHIDVIKGLIYKIEGTYTSIKDSANNDVTVTNGEFTPSANDTYTMVGGSCVHLKWSGVRDGDTEEHWDNTLSLPVATYFADGMRSAGTVYDELQKDKYIKRIGMVDLGSLQWTRDQQAHLYHFRAQMPSDARKYGGADFPNAKIIRYDPVTPNTEWGTSTLDRVFTVNTSGTIYIIDSAYTDAAAFKTAMSGVYLFYELAEPVETPISPELNFVYRCDDFGTEMLLPQNDDEPVTAPLNADIIYQLDYEANVRNNDSLTITKESMDNFITAFNASGIGTITQVWDAVNNKYVYTVVKTEAQTNE